MYKNTTTSETSQNNVDNSSINSTSMSEQRLLTTTLVNDKVSSERNKNTTDKKSKTRAITNTTVPYNLTRVPNAVQSIKHNNDIANYVGIDVSNLSDFEVRDLIKNVYQPAKNHKFPPTPFGKKGEKRSFQYSCLKTFPWLRYSQDKNAAYCVSCVFFAKKFPDIKKVSNLVSEPFDYWPNATYLFRKHSAVFCFTHFCHFQQLACVYNTVLSQKQFSSREKSS